MFFILIPVTPFLLYNLDNIFAISPSFERVTFDDNIAHNIDTVDQLNEGDNLFPLSLPLNVTSLSYLSNGELFNATLWLSEPIDDTKHFEYVNVNLTYSMFIDMLQIDGTIIPTYNVYLYPEKDKTWTKKITEIDPSGTLLEKTLDIQRNYTGFYENGNQYIDISIDLKSIGYPSKFIVSFLTQAHNYRESVLLQDYTVWDTIPPGPLLITYDWPSPAKVKIGGKMEFLVPINALGLNMQENVTLSDANKNDKVILSFDPPFLILPINGTKFTKMTIEINDKFPVSGRINTQSVNITRTVYDESNDPTSVSMPIYESQSFSLIPLPSSSTIEKINDFLINYYGIYILPFGITSIFAIVLTKRVNTAALAESIRIKDLLTTNGSIIAGVLIFLTIGGTIQKEKFWQIGILTASIVYPFALSAIITMATGSIQKGIRYTIPGFVYLMVSIVLIVFVQSK